MSVKNTKVPKVSVLMPIYNTPAAHLKESIDSILEQTFKDFEFLILNDSPANRKLDAQVASYDDPRIKYLKNDANMGLEASTNRLIDEAEGEYLAIFDHDDISLPERLQKEVKFLDDNPEYGVVSAQFRLFGMQNFDTGNPTEDDEIKAMLLTASCVSHTTAMFRKSVLLKNNIRYEKEYFPAASYRIITRLALVTKVKNLPEVLLKYRMDGNNTSLKHAETRVRARERVSSEYGKDLLKKTWEQKRVSFDSIEQLGVSPRFKDSRYYRANQDDEAVFIKSDGKDLENEYRMTKLMYKKSKDHFIEPLYYHKGKLDYLALRWCDGTRLDQYMKQNTVSKKQKSSFIKDLNAILKLLRAAGVVHRDITPHNLLVVSGTLKLVDFHFAVMYEDYQELEFVKKNIDEVSMMGEPYAPGIFMWDDAFSLTKIAEYIVGEESTDEYPMIQKMSKHIGERVIVPDGAILRDVIVKQRQAIQALQANNNTVKVKIKKAVKNTIGYRAGRKAYRLAKKHTGRS